MRSIRAPIGKRLGLDLLLIASIAAVLTTVHVLVPSPLREQLALRPADPQWYTLQTAAYIHASFDHLQANLIGYLLAVSYAYWLCLYLERRQWFWQTTIGLLVITPVVVNSANVVLYGTYLPDVDGVARGFSGVVAAFAGFLLVGFLAAIREAHTAQLAQAVGVGLILLLLLLIDTVYARTVRPIVAGLVAFGVCVQAAPLLYHRDWDTVIHARSREQLLFQIAGASFIVLILTILTLQMFPAELVLDNAFVNIFAHGIGFIFGLVLSSVTSLYPE